MIFSGCAKETANSMASTIPSPSSPTLVEKSSQPEVQLESTQTIPPETVSYTHLTLPTTPYV